MMIMVMVMMVRGGTDDDIHDVQVGNFEEWSKRTGQHVINRQAEGIQKNWKVNLCEFTGFWTNNLFGM